MKKILALFSALFIVTGLKAQKANAQKETVKPRADSLVKQVANKQLNRAAAQQKDVKIAPVLKYAPATKVVPALAKAEKQVPIHQ